MAPIGESGAADVAAGMGDEPSAAGAAPGAGPAGKKGSYVPPALRGDRGAGERMGSKFGERDDLATLRVTNVSVFGTAMSSPGDNLLMLQHRSPRWPRRENCGICSSVSVASPESSWPRTGKPAWPRVLRSSASQTEAMPSRLATRWTGLVSSILFCGWSSPRRLSRLFHTCQGVS